MWIKSQMFCVKVFSLQFTSAARLTPDAIEITRDYLWIKSSSSNFLWKMNHSKFQRRYPWCIHDPTVHRAKQMVMPVMKQLGVHTTVCLAIGRQLLQEGECRVDQVDGLLSRSAHSARGRANSIWRTRSFVCLAVPGQQTPPSTAERIDLSLNGFGKKNNVS